MENLHAWLFHISANIIYDWHLFALLALLFYGTYQYLIDSSIESSTDTFAVPMITYLLLGGASLTILVLSGLYLVTMSIRGQYITGITLALLLGLLQGTLFLLAHLFRFEARKVFPNSVVLPITRTNVLIVILVSWVLFDEFSSINANNLVGFTLIGMAIYLFKDFKVQEGATSASINRDVITTRQTAAKIYLLFATVVSAAISLLAKYAVGPSNLNIFLFMFLSNYAIAFAAYYLFRKHIRAFSARKPQVPAGNPSDLRKIRRIFVRGMCLGVLNFIAFASLLNALSLSEASVVVPIYSLYIIIPVLLTAIIQGKILTQKTTVAVILSVAALIILK